MRPVIELAAPGGFTVAVLRDDDGLLWIGSRHESGERYGTGRSGARVEVTGGPGWTACGGVLPDGAARAVVRGAAECVEAQGAWLAVVPGRHHDPAVRFEAPDGTFVTEPPRGEPMSDETIPCPACERTDWEQTEDEVRCRACGYALGLGGMYSYSSGDRPSVRSIVAGFLRVRRLRRSFEHDAEKALRRASGPVYSVAGAEATVRGYGGRPGKTDQLTLASGEIAVETRFDSYDTAEEAAREALASLVTNAGGTPATAEAPSMGSHAGMAIWFDATRRAGAEAAARADVANVEIAVDGEPRKFTLVCAAERWAAATDGIVVSGQGPLPAALSSER